VLGQLTRADSPLPLSLLLSSPCPAHPTNAPLHIQASELKYTANTQTAQLHARYTGQSTAPSPLASSSALEDSLTSSAPRLLPVGRAVDVDTDEGLTNARYRTRRRHQVVRYPRPSPSSPDPTRDPVQTFAEPPTRALLQRMDDAPTPPPSSVTPPCCSTSPSQTAKRPRGQSLN
jgi:hypothetical protein